MFLPPASSTPISASDLRPPIIVAQRRPNQEKRREPQIRCCPCIRCYTSLFALFRVFSGQFPSVGRCFLLSFTLHPSSFPLPHSLYILHSFSVGGPFISRPAGTHFTNHPVLFHPSSFLFSLPLSRFFACLAGNSNPSADTFPHLSSFSLPFWLPLNRSSPWRSRIIHSLLSLPNSSINPSGVHSLPRNIFTRFPSRSITTVRRECVMSTESSFPGTTVIPNCSPK